MMDARVQDWLERDPDPQTRRKLEELVRSGNEEEIDRRFAGRLRFGTAGLRALIGAGPTRMNRLVVRETTAGLGAYLLATVPEAARRGVVVSYDARRGSKTFAEDTAGVLAGLGVKCYLAHQSQPTPICPFAIGHLGAAAGVVITASHNPPDYNGYKVYWDNGAQILPPHDAGIAAEIERAARAPLPWMEPEEARASRRIVWLEPDITTRYLEAIRALSIHEEDPGRTQLGIAYTALHGVAGALALRALKRAGFERIFTVPEQQEPDGCFPTLRFPNPEEPGAMDRVLELARQKAAELVFANDPDGDRLAVAVRSPQGDYRRLSGDEVGVLLGADRLDAAREPVTVVTTIVSSRMLGAVARGRGADSVETLTGFKWIVNEGLKRQAQGYRFVFGYEEALGYTFGSVVPDKDGIAAMVAFAELAAECWRHGKSVLHRLEELYRRYGLFLTAQRSLPLEPAATASRLTEKLRSASPASIGGRPLVSCLDVREGERRSPDGRCEPSPFPRSDVLVYELEGGARVVVRPSGTEPKLKCYYELQEAVAADEPLGAAEKRGRAALAELVESHQKALAHLQVPLGDVEGGNDTTRNA